jgi:Lar family restriction alleviation protein
MTNPKPCPFCGHVGVSICEGSTFRWRVAECNDCGAIGPEERIQTTGNGTPDEWEENVRGRVIETWNTRAIMPTPGALKEILSNDL